METQRKDVRNLLYSRRLLTITTTMTKTDAIRFDLIWCDNNVGCVFLGGGGRGGGQPDLHPKWRGPSFSKILGAPIYAHTVSETVTNF